MNKRKISRGMLIDRGGRVRLPATLGYVVKRLRRRATYRCRRPVPILAGPGTIATAMNFVATGGFFYISTTIGGFFVLCVITYLFFISGERLVQYVGQSAINAVTRLMGLILAVIGTQMVIDGIEDVVHSL